MKTLDLEQLRLQDFRSIIDPLVLKFPHRGLFAIRGKNLGTGGSSRVGKSSINLGIAHALGYCPYPATELQSWFTEEPPKVSLTVRTPEHLLDVSRGQKFSLSVDGVTTKGGAKTAAGELQLHLGLTPDMLSALTYREQGSKGTFLSKTNVGIQEFFTSVLALQPYEKAAEEALERAAKAVGTTGNLTASVEYGRLDLEKRRRDHEDNLGQYAPKDTGAMEVELLAAEADIAKWSANKAIVAKAVKAQEEKRDAQVVSEVLTLETQARALDTKASLAEGQLRGIEAELRTLKGVISNVAQEISSDQQVRKVVGSGVIACPDQTPNSAMPEALEELATQLELQVDEQRVIAAKADAEAVIASTQVEKKKTACGALQDSTTCSECGRPFENADDIANHAKAMEAEVKLLEAAEHRANKTAGFEHMHLAQFEGMARAARLDARLATNRAKLKVLQDNACSIEEHALIFSTEVKALREDAEAVRSSVFAKREAILASFRANFEALRKAGADADTRWTAAKDRAKELDISLVYAREQNQRQAQARKAAEKVLQDLETTLQGLQVELAEAQRVQGQERDFAAMVGREGFLGAIFDEVLAEVAEQTNAILARVPNVSDVTLAFRSETITEKGTTKRGITPVVTIGGHEAQLKSGCSGGMLGAVYLATDLAVIDVVSRRLGVSPGWLVLDESFEGLGPVEKEGYLEVLQVYAQKKLVLIVDHGTETKEAIPGIDLVYENGRTRLEVASG